MRLVQLLRKLQWMLSSLHWCQPGSEKATIMRTVPRKVFIHRTDNVLSLALREVLASNAEPFFFLQPDSPASIPYRSKMTSTMTGQPRKRKRSQDEENMYKAQLAATGLILLAFGRLPRGQSHPQFR
uniref:Uncharacterized protein n=1 Tax=Attheya septentrionalis TaxID=420275 RepID=A0A7S2U8U6_9STRA|mmetsp:Transcript_15402/g.27967  ORF Transcript_15402/g.27967 Transcript_15402/m.27967 type:complete len:127 (+) Transcript_15402:516-896(+)